MKRQENSSEESIVKTMFSIVLIFLTYQTYAESTSESSSQNNVNVNEPITINYGSSPWNTDSGSIDTAFVFVKDTNSGKIVKILLDETEPDSSKFSGKFYLSLEKGKEVNPQLFIPPQKLKEEDKDFTFQKLLRQGKIKRKPVVFRNLEGEKSLHVFDTKKQAINALQVFKEQLKLAQESKSLTKPIPDKSTLEAQRLAEKQLMLAKLAQEAANRESERQRKEQLEKQRIEELKRQQLAMKEAEIKARQQEAQKYADQALLSYRDGDYKNARLNFKKATELDPNNTSYYFKYAVSLYRLEQFNEALVIFKVTESVGAELIEKQYYMALVHYRLKELQPALANFQNVQDSKHPILGPSAAFYRGVILFGEEKFKPSKEAFEFVLDTSKDPKLDQKAEEFIEKIARIEMFKANQEKPNVVSGTVGISYDSNVLNSPDSSDQGTSTNVASPRFLGMGSYERRLIYERTHEWSAKVSSLYMYSTDSGASSADPFLNTVTSPYTLKGKLWGKGHKLTITPGFEALFMDAESNGTRSNILNSITLNISSTLIMSDQLFSTYILDFRNDDSNLTITDNADNSDANKITLKTSQTYFVDSSKKRAWIGNLAYILNNASGDNKTYNRIDAGFTYMAPIKKWDATWTAGLAYYLLNYSKSSDSRKDNNLTASGSLSKPFVKWFTGGLSGNYSTNSSSTATYTYKKYTVMLTGTFNTSF